MTHTIAKFRRHIFAGMARSYGISTTTLSSGNGKIAISFYAKLAHRLKRFTIFHHQLQVLFQQPTVCNHAHP